MKQVDTEYVAWNEILRSPYLGPLSLASMGVWLHASDELIIATMLPSIVSEVGGANLISWTFALYEIGSIAAGAASALITMRHGIRLPMALAALLFALGCGAAAAAPNMETVLAGRLLQGFGAGALVAMAFIVVGSLFPARLAARALAVVSALWGIAAFAGPLIGGLFVEYWNWRAGFLFFGLQALLLAAAILLVERTAENPQTKPGATFPGLRLGVLSLGVLLIAWAGAAPDPWRTVPGVLGGIAMLALFLHIDARRADDRLLPRSPFGFREPVAAGLTMMFCFSVATIPFAIFGPLLVIRLHGASALVAGYLLACVSFGWTLFSIAVSGSPERNDPKLILAGMLLITLSIPGYLLAVPRGPIAAIAAVAFLEGGGFGLAWTFVLRRAIALAPAGEVERVSGAIPTIQRIGYATGAAITGLVANAAGMASEQASMETVSNAIFLASLPPALLGLAAAAAFLRPRPTRLG